MKKISLFVFVALGLTACGSQYSSNNEAVIMHSRNGEKLVVPPPLTGENLSSNYDLPTQMQVAKVSIAPPP